MKSFYIVRNAQGSYLASSKAWMRSSAQAKRFSRARDISFALQSSSPALAPFEIIQVIITEAHSVIGKINSIGNWKTENEPEI